MGACAGLDIHQARRHVPKEGDELGPAQALLQRGLAASIDPVHLENCLCNVQTDGRSVHLGRSSSVSGLQTQPLLARLMPL
jgi:hypothetical protein